MLTIADALGAALHRIYFQSFCGETYFQTKLPLDRTSMSVGRGRIGAEKLELLLAETLAAAAERARSRTVI